LEERPSTFLRIAAPLRGFVQRFTYLGLILAAFGLMLVGKADTVLVDRARTHVTDAVAPILDAMSKPVTTFTRAVDNVRSLADIRAENARLREENARLRDWQMAARQLDAENQAFQKLLNVVPESAVSHHTARVIADSGSGFSHSIILNAGKSQGIRDGQAVLGDDGFIGRIVGAGSRASRVLLITDISSRIPVVIESTRVRAVMAGNNSGRPRLLHTLPSARITPGQRVVTSGHGGAFPAGLPVGIVAAVTDGGIEVQPYMSRERLEFVRAADFGLGGILESEDRTGPASGGK